MTEKLESGLVAKNGLGILTAAIFISGEMVGSGILALPRAIVDADSRKIDTEPRFNTNVKSDMIVLNR